MKKFSYLINEMHFMEFVLLKARVLQVLYVTLDFYATCSNEEVVTEIAEYPRASSDAQVIFMGREPDLQIMNAEASSPPRILMMRYQ